MKFAYTMLLILVTLFFVSGCSEEKPEVHASKNVVRKAIKKPVRETSNREEVKKEIAENVKKDIDKGINQETSGTLDIDRKIDKGASETQGVGRGTNQKIPETQDVDREISQKSPKKEDLPAHETDIYITRQGDNLLAISAKAEIYNNPLKWPLLYRENREALSSLMDKDNLFNGSLPAGIKLKFISKEEVDKNLENRPGRYYVVNLISSPYMKEIAPQVIKLIDAGFFAYISSTMVDNREWYRLRAGFYKTRSEANREGDNIKTRLKIPDIWTAKIGNAEYRDYGGY